MKRKHLGALVILALLLGIGFCSLTYVGYVKLAPLLRRPSLASVPTDFDKMTSQEKRDTLLLLGHLGSNADPALRAKILRLVKDPDGAVRNDGLGYLTSYTNAEDLPIFIAAADDPEEVVRINVLMVFLPQMKLLAHGPLPHPTTLPATTLPATTLPTTTLPTTAPSAPAGYRVLAHEPSWVTALCHVPQENFLLSAGMFANIRCRSLATGAVDEIPTGHQATVVSLAYDAASDLLASSDVDGTIVISRVRDRKILSRNSKAHTKAALALAWSATGQRLVSTGEEGKIKCWQVSPAGDLKPLWTQSVKAEIVSAATVVVIGDELVVSVGEDQAIRTFELATGKRLVDTSFPGSRYWSLCLSPDASKVFCSGRGGLYNPCTFTVLDPRSGNRLHFWKGHEFFVWGLQITPDGKRLISAGWDQRLCIWEANTGKLLHEVNLAPYRPDALKLIGNQLYVGTINGPILQVDLPV